MRTHIKALTADKMVALTVLVSALGYFVDIFDLLLFGIVRMQSLRDLGVPEADLLSSGIYLLNTQMAGLLLGGIAWGVAGDKYGRLSVLFGSILVYSLANIANGFVQTVDQYAFWRLISGFGLAGELGIGITLASELLPRMSRGLGTTFIATVGVMGATFAAVIADLTDWRTAYIIGGVMGLGLLALRVKAIESGMYRAVEKKEKAARGNLLLFFRRPELLKRYVAVILIGAPLWAVTGVLVTFAPEFGRDFGMTVLPTAGKAIFYFYLGLVFGDLGSGFLSQFLQSRRKAVAVFLCLLAISVFSFALLKPQTLSFYYACTFVMGIATGYWAMFVQMGAEQFGTNLRATAATSIPNMVRSVTIPSTIGFQALTPVLGVTNSGLAVVTVALFGAALSLFFIRETFHADLDYIET